MDAAEAVKVLILVALLGAMFWLIGYIGGDK